MSEFAHREKLRRDPSRQHPARRRHDERLPLLKARSAGKPLDVEASSGTALDGYREHQSFGAPVGQQEPRLNRQVRPAPSQ